MLLVAILCTQAIKSDATLTDSPKLYCLSRTRPLSSRLVVLLVSPQPPSHTSVSAMECAEKDARGSVNLTHAQPSHQRGYTVCYRSGESTPSDSLHRRVSACTLGTLGTLSIAYQSIPCRKDTARNDEEGGNGVYVYVSHGASRPGSTRVTCARAALVSGCGRRSRWLRQRMGSDKCEGIGNKEE